MLSTILRVNGEEIDRCSIVNRGHPETGTHPYDDDLRIYEVTHKASMQKFHVLHRRSHGAWALMAKVAEKIAQEGR